MTRLVLTLAGLIAFVAPAAAQVTIIPERSTPVPGATTQCIFNDAGVLGADAGCTYNKTTDTLTLSGSGTGGALDSRNLVVGGAAFSVSAGTANALLYNNGVFGWTNNGSSSPGDAYDTGIKRNGAAGAFRIGNAGMADTFDITVGAATTTIAAEAGSTITFGSSILGSSATFSGNITTGSQVVVGSAACVIRSGTGSPEGVFNGNVCDIFLRSGGGAATTLYVKESGVGTTGWVAK